MKTMFTRQQWGPALGQFDWTSIITSGLQAGTQAYQQYAKQEIAEEEAEAKRAEAEAARLRAQAEQARLLTEEARGPGIPTPYLVAGGIGLAALLALLAFSR